MKKRLAALIVLGVLGAYTASLASGRSPVRTSSSVVPYTASTITPYTSSTTKADACKDAVRAQSWFYGLWGTWVPGAVYDTANYRWFSTGAQGKALRIRADHTWSWHGLKGRWKRGDSEYPLVLVHALSGHNWKVGTGPCYVHGAQIAIWDGYSYYYGKRAKR